jgi:hypothetical protein
MVFSAKLRLNLKIFLKLYFSKFSHFVEAFIHAIIILSRANVQRRCVIDIHWSCNYFYFYFYFFFPFLDHSICFFLFPKVHFNNEKNNI